MWRWWPRGRQGSDPTEGDPISREKERALKLFGGPEEPHPYTIDPVVRPGSRTSAYSSSASANARWRMSIITVGILAGGVLGLLLFVDDPKMLLVGPRKWLAEVSGSTGYIDCAHVRLAGAAPLKKGDKGYTRRLDADGDGVACEPIMSDSEGADSETDKPKRKKKQ